jgi:hypothetical protein
MFQSRFNSSHDENLETFGDGAYVPGQALNLPIVAFVATLKRASEFRKARGDRRKLDTCP